MTDKESGSQGTGQEQGQGQTGGSESPNQGGGQGNQPVQNPIGVRPLKKGITHPRRDYGSSSSLR